MVRSNVSRTFATFYNWTFLIKMIHVFRFIFIIWSNRVRSFGIARLINTAIILMIVIPFLMTLSLQFPVSDFIHGPFNHCRGRFEVFFNPTHPDPITPGKFC